MSSAPYDRSAEDLGNVVELGHVNVRVPDQRLATAFYISGLGLTRDPYLMTGIDNMWANVGVSQFHLPTGAPQVVRGVTGLVLPDLKALAARLERVGSVLTGTQFRFEVAAEHVEAVCPWGNRIRCHAPDAARWGRVQLGMPYVELAVPRGSTAGIARFYRSLLGAVAGAEGGVARVRIAADRYLLFRETDAAAAPFDGHHVQISLADFSGPHRRLGERGLITEESNQHQYRFQDIVDPESGAVLFTLEHEVRSMTHPMFARPLVNRNPAITNTSYAPGHEALAWSIGEA